jgi:hypothetical protein
LASFDPQRWCRARTALTIAFMLAAVAGALFITWLALRPPVLGTISTIGGALGLAFFLLIQPAGTMARDAVLLPSHAHLRGSWVKAGSEGDGGPAVGEGLYADD